MSDIELFPVEARRHKVRDRIVAPFGDRLNVIQGRSEPRQLLAAVFAQITIALEHLEPVLSHVVVVEIARHIDGRGWGGRSGLYQLATSGNLLRKKDTIRRAISGWFSDALDRAPFFKPLESTSRGLNTQGVALPAGRSNDAVHQATGAHAAILVA